MSELTYPKTEYQQNNLLNVVSSNSSKSSSSYSSKSSSSSFFRFSIDKIIPIPGFEDNYTLTRENFPELSKDINIENLINKSNLFIKVSNIISSQSIIKDFINIGQESFLLEKEDNNFYLSHPKWSLVGMGKNLYDAEIDILKEAKELLNDMRELPPDSLSQEALDLLDYLFSIV